MRNAAASRPLRYSRSLYLSSKTGGWGNFWGVFFTLAASAADSWVEWVWVGTEEKMVVSVAVGGAILDVVMSWD